MCFLNVILIWFEKILIRFWYGSNVILIWFQDFLGFPVGWLENARKKCFGKFPQDFYDFDVVWYDFDLICLWYEFDVVLICLGVPVGLLEERKQK